ncbi:MAG: hypothetical protein M3O31_00690 [Acidobacteriota bacterium]|nr:hypothetical protein [Acidobacteriota bacterium]
MSGELKGRQIHIDKKADSADPSLPAFLSRAESAPLYRGFLVLDDIEIEGFKLGMISGFGGEWSNDSGFLGDAFVVAPDNSRCGLVWEVGVFASPRMTYLKSDGKIETCRKSDLPAHSRLGGLR